MKFLTSTFLALLLGISSALDMGCAYIYDDYEIVFENQGITRLEGVKVSYGDFSSSAGVLPPGIEATHLLVGEEAPLPQEIRVNWIRSSDGEQFDKTISLEERNRFVGELRISFNDSHVEARLEERD